MRKENVWQRKRRLFSEGLAQLIKRLKYEDDFENMFDELSNQARDLLEPPEYKRFLRHITYEVVDESECIILEGVDGSLPVIEKVERFQEKLKEDPYGNWF